MPSEPQHKLRSFIRNSLTFNVMKHGAGSSANNTAINVDRRAATEDRTPSQMETTTRTSQQEDNGRVVGSDIPNSAHSSSPSIHTRVSNFPHMQTEPVTMSSSRQAKRRDKSNSDDHRSHSHPLRRHPNALPAPEVPDIDKNKTSAEKQNLPGTDLLTEFERLRKEMEALKKAAHDQRKAMKKQAKKYEELRNEVAANAVALTDKNLELAAKDEELRKIKDNFGKLENCISSVESALLCQICIETLHRPHALSPCGHVFCLLCLQEWFRKSPVGDNDDMEDLDNPRYVVLRPKSCPCCRTRITHRPIPLFILRGVTNTLAASKAQLLGTSCRPESPIFDHDSDPWKGIFPSNDDDDDDESASGRRSSSHSVGADSLAESDDRLSGRFTQYSDGFMGYGFESDSESEGAGAPYTRDDGSDDGDIYVNPRWQPPLSFASYRSDAGGSDQENNNPTTSLIRRGCPLQMVLSFHMTYNREEGIIAHVPSLEPSLFLDHGNIDIEMMHRIFLGWNIQVDDRDGCAYMQQMLTELDEYPDRWAVRPRNGVPDGFEVYDAMRLVRRSDIDQYSSDGVSYFDGAELD
ncbi:hypothetical protein JOM56_007306 [Amanita muscaria]